MESQINEGVLTGKEAEDCIGIEFNPVRAGFHGGQDVWTRDVLNLGVRPDKAIAKVLQWPKISLHHSVPGDMTPGMCCCPIKRQQAHI